MISRFGSLMGISGERYARKKPGGWGLEALRNDITQEEKDEKVVAVMVCFVSETTRVEGSIMKSLRILKRQGLFKLGLSGKKEGELSLLSSMPPVAVSQVSPGVESCVCVAGSLNGRSVGSDV